MFRHAKLPQTSRPTLASYYSYTLSYPLESSSFSYILRSRQMDTTEVWREREREKKDSMLKLSTAVQGKFKHTARKQPSESCVM